MTTTAIILAGGRSSRFGGDKRLAIVDGVPILARVIRAVAEAADEVVLVLEPGAAALPPDPPWGIPVLTVHDRVAYAGPLAALAAGLRAASGSKVVVVAGDMPWMESAVLRRLVGAVDGGGTWALDSPPPATGHDVPDPVLPFAGETATLVDATAALLALGSRRLGDLLIATAARRIPGEAWLALDPEARTLLDVDRPEDLAPGH